MSNRTDLIAADAGPGVQEDARVVQRGWLRIGIGLAVAGQAMIFSLAVNLTPAEGAAYWLVHGGLLTSALGVLVFLGRDMVGEAWSALRARRVSIDLLFLVTLLGALAGSLTSTLTGRGAIYYEVVAVLVAVHTLGKMIGARSRAAALRAADAVAEKYETCVVLGSDGGEERRAVASLRGGERVVVVPGGAICVDGVGAEGRAYVEEAAMTGEWRPASRGPGDRVWAGTHARDGRLVIVAGAGPRRLDGVLRAVAEARLAPSALQAQADRLMGWWLPVVLGVSAATFGGWLLGGASWDRALFNAMAVLLVACPCAMGLATPVAVWGGLARLARLGIVARSGDFLDALARVDQVCFDKTGTLSEERLTVEGWEFSEAWRGREEELKAAVAAVERGMAHPVARALELGGGSLERGAGSRELGVTEVGVSAGQGVEALVAGVGRVRVGERAFCGGAAVAGDTKTVWVAVDGAEAARVTLVETWREGLAEALSELRGLGLELEILTGDPQAGNGWASGPWGDEVAVRAGLTPAEKTSRVAELAAGGRRVLFAGDGVNDAAAMGAASCSLALRGGNELARAAAMAVCAGDDLRRLPEAVRLAREVVAGVHGNLRFAAAYNLAGMALAAAGWLHPVVAALLMVGSSAWVGVRALRSTQP
ncbi:MAG: heavy metal translocating P-type ATPase [Verrucomicrobia bacterium]|nr:heavy metal translocating P-type ATPase [Verrucomicrobiota bacterium]